MADVQSVRVKLPQEVEVRVWELGDGRTKVSVGPFPLYSTDNLTVEELVEELEGLDVPEYALEYLLELTEDTALRQADRWRD